RSTRVSLAPSTVVLSISYIFGRLTTALIPHKNWIIQNDILCPSFRYLFSDIFMLF
ncbi:hypothetical protein DPEC_G00079950, partial [Dallia pectoralis]